MDRDSRKKDDRSAVRSSIDTILQPLYALLSPPFLKAYFQTILLFVAGVLLLSVAVAAYLSFYYAYVPVRGLSVPVHLQYPFAQAAYTHAHPFGVTRLDSRLVSRQRYDVKVVMRLPRVLDNQQAGNFMVDIKLRVPGQSPIDVIASAVTGEGIKKEEEVIVSESRPAILTYRSVPIDLAHRLARLPLYVIGWAQEAEEVTVPILDGIIFEKGWRNQPTSLWLGIRSQRPLQMYSVKVVFTAKFEGLRYIMYNYRISSLIAFTTAFWLVEMTCAIITWSVFSYMFSQALSGPKSEPISHAADHRIKQESELEGIETAASLSDTSRVFPSLSSHPPLQYSGSRIKQEETEETQAVLKDPPTTVAEADDEDEDADFVFDGLGPRPMGDRLVSDSGLGTSMDSGIDRGKAVRKRRSGGVMGTESS